MLTLKTVPVFVFVVFNLFICSLAIENIICRINRNCTGVECPIVNCTHNQTLLPPKCGECCSRCGTSISVSANITVGLSGKCLIKTDCTSVKCPVLDCPNNTSIVPPKCGECCSSCSPPKGDISVNIKVNCTGDDCSATTSSIPSLYVSGKISLNNTIKANCTGEQCLTSSPSSIHLSGNVTQVPIKLSTEDYEVKANCSTVSCPQLDCGTNSTLSPPKEGDCCPSCLSTNSSFVTTTIEP